MKKTSGQAAFTNTHDHENTRVLAVAVSGERGEGETEDRFFNLSKREQLEGEKKLCFFLLEDALDLLNRAPQALPKVRRKERDEIIVWIKCEGYYSPACKEIRWPFTFDAVCDTIGIDSEAARRALLKKA